MTNIEVYGLRKSAVYSVHCDVGSCRAELQTQAAVALRHLPYVTQIRSEHSGCSECVIFCAACRTEVS